MSKEGFMIQSCSETLQVTSEGKYQLEIEGTATSYKKLTPKQAKDWFKKRYPEDLSEWEEIIKEANEWRTKRGLKQG